MSFTLAQDLFPLIAASLAAVSCALLGNFLVLRRLSMMGDAISHSVLPGIVMAFLVFSTRNPLVMIGGAAAAGVLTVVLVELVKRLGRVEPGAAMGVVFSVLFALGVLMIEQAAARHTDLDADCVLHGQLEFLTWWDAPASIGGLWSGETLNAIPRQVWTLFAVTAAVMAFVIVLFKELRIAAFDAGLATALGYNATFMHYALMVLVAGATVAAFEAVGSILVIAMLVCPAATARLLTDRLTTQIVLSVVIALVGSIGGYAAATAIPAMFDADSVKAAGSITVALGLLLALAALGAPRHGVVVRRLRQRSLMREAEAEDTAAAVLLAVKGGAAASIGSLPAAYRRGLRAAQRRGLVAVAGDQVSLTPRGSEAAEGLLRRRGHWAQYLVARVGVAPDHLDETLERVEHLGLQPPEGGAEQTGGENDPKEA